MRLLTLIFLFCFYGHCFSQTKPISVAVGLNYRFYPLDIEDAGYNNVTSKGLPPDDLFFWKSLNLFGEAGLPLKKNWQISFSSYFRYNHMNWEEGENLQNLSSGKRKEKKNFKCDLFLNGEKLFQVSKKKKHFITTGIGLGITNINSRFDITLQDTLENGSTTSPKRYKGNITHFGPKVDIGYLANKLKFTLTIFVVEGPDLNNLTSLWPGLSVSYLFKRNKK